MNNTMYHLIFRRLDMRIGRYLPVFLLVAIFSSCQKTGFTYNNIVDNNQQTEYLLADTLTVTMKTIFQDSIPTSDNDVVLVGKRTDPQFGVTMAQSFFQIQQPAPVDIPLVGADYDSMVLIMRPNGYISGDSLQPADLQVYRVTSTIQTAQNFYYLYNNSNFSTENTPIGSFRGSVWPNTDPTVTVPMSDQLGRQLFIMLRDKSGDITANTNWLYFFPGLNVRGGPTSQSVLGFKATDSSLVMRLYYHISELVTTVKYVDFNMQAPNLQFNRVTNNAAGTALAPLQQGVLQLPSESTNHQGYTQPITGSATRIDIPYLRNLNTIGQFFKVMKVYLYLKPVNGTYDNDRLPPRMALNEVDALNNVTDTLTYGLLTKDTQFPDNNAYTFDLTNYFIKELTATDFTSRGLLLTPSATDARTTLDRLVVGDQQNTKYRLKLQLYYLLYK
ncbi:DUF4270 family protein [Chitinophaga sp. 30R24]|uniref:DUF4270 family protein n=1 Tax=Chitinophaga sp. 30R24 TaxID=3248838 RepID=UPI003B907233